MKAQSILFIREDGRIFNSGNLPVEVRNILYNDFILIDEKNKLNKSLIRDEVSCFVGIYSSEDLLVVGYPKYMKYDLHMNYYDETIPLPLEAKELMKQMKIVCGCIERADRQKGKILNDFLYKKKESENISKLYLAEKLIKDYNDHGIITVPIEEDTYGRGKTDWAKTIKLQHPVSINHKTIYFKTIQTYSGDDEKANISIIHMKAITEIVGLFGIMLGYNSYALMFDDYYNSPWKSIDNTSIVQHLKGWLKNSFSDRDVNLIHMLIAWFRDGIDISNNKNYYGTTSFRSVFEGMCQEMFLDDETWKKYMPSVTYRIHSKAGITEVPLSDVLKPDLTYDMREEGKYLIFDAKYYAFNLDGKRGFPAISDVDKQKSYFKYIREGINDDTVDIYNVFLLPQFVNEPAEWFEETISYVGDTFLPDDISETTEKDKSECVDLIQLDMLRFTTDYASGGRMFDKEKYKRFITYIDKMKK